LRAQIETALAAGVDVTHLDSHMFVLHGQRSEFRRIYLGLANEYRLPVRAVRRGLLVPLSLKWTISNPLLVLAAGKASAETQSLLCTNAA
jgi:hypothetical protein